MPELARWSNVYIIVGGAAGALIGLQFVVLTLIADRPSLSTPEGGAAFGSPTIVHFSSVLFLSAALHAPFNSIVGAAVLWGALGFVGVVYSLIVVRRLRNQSIYHPVLEDWLFHVATPLISYSALAISPFAIRFHERQAFVALQLRCCCCFSLASTTPETASSTTCLSSRRGDMASSGGMEGNSS
jgi:hypothetical protein